MYSTLLQSTDNKAIKLNGNEYAIYDELLTSSSEYSVLPYIYCINQVLYIIIYIIENIYLNFENDFIKQSISGFFLIDNFYTFSTTCYQIEKHAKMDGRISHHILKSWD